MSVATPARVTAGQVVPGDRIGLPGWPKVDKVQRAAGGRVRLVLAGGRPFPPVTSSAPILVRHEGEPTPQESPLVAELRAARLDFNRPAVPTVYAEYVAYVATGYYPYNTDVEAFITKRNAVPTELAKQLAREVYLASGQHRLAGIVTAEEEARTEGWVAVTDVEPADGMVLDVRGREDGPFRAKPTGKDYAPWVLLPKGKRTHGIDLADLVRRHKAYEDAKARGQVEMDGPAVVMVRPVTKATRKA